MNAVLTAAAALLAQRLLGLPPLPGWTAMLLVPVVLLVAPAVLDNRRPGPLAALALGLGWDLVLGPVIGPGGIAWSFAAVSVGGLAAVVANRSVVAWAGFGAVGAAAVVVGQWIALLPLGVAPALGPRRLLMSMALTGAWCGAVGWIESLDLPARWTRWRSRRLR